MEPRLSRIRNGAAGGGAAPLRIQNLKRTPAVKAVPTTS